MVTARLSIWDWTWEPTVLVGLLLALVLYATLWRTGALRASDDVSPWTPASWWRPVLFGIGLATILVALCSPVDRGGDRFLFTLHMAQHLLLMMVAPPLLLLGIAGLHALPPERLRTIRTLWFVITRPWIATVIFNGVLLVWHLPVLYDTTLTNPVVHVFEHLTFLGAGFVFWWHVVDPVRDSTTVPITPLTKVATLALSGLPQTVLGLVFALDPHVVYDFYAGAPRLWGITPVADQQYAGALMFGAGNIIFFIAISIVFLRMFEDPAKDEVPAAPRSHASIR